MKNPTLALISALLGLSLIPAPAEAQTDDEDIAAFEFESGETSMLVGTPHPALFSDFKVEGYDYLEATVSVEDSGATITWAPFLLPPKAGEKPSFWSDVWSETRLQLSQKDDVTSLGVSLKWNPLSPVSNNGKSVWEDYWDEVRAKNPDSTFPLYLASAKKIRKSKLKGQELQGLTQLADQRCPISRLPWPEFLADVENLRKEVLEPEARQNHATGQLLYRTHCALVRLDEEISELEIEINGLRFATENPDEELIKQKQALLKPLSKAFPTLLQVAERSYIAHRANEHGITKLMAIRAEIAELDKSIEATEGSYAAAAYLGYREKLYSSGKPVINLSYINSFFNVISGGRVDNDDDGLNDNEHRLKSRSLALTLDWQLGTKNGLSLLLSRSHERSSAEEGAAAADYDGFGVTWSRLITILDKDGYRKTKDYRESLFVPSIVFGIAYENRDCDSPDADCAMGRLRSEALTPFVDFKIKKSAQFRIGVPFRSDRIFRTGEGETEEDSIEVVSLVAFQLGAPN